MNIFELNGLPSEENPYLFNGDFVDRGSFSVESILTLFALKLLYPNSLYLARGVHNCASCTCPTYHYGLCAYHSSTSPSTFTFTSRSRSRSLDELGT